MDLVVYVVCGVLMVVGCGLLLSSVVGLFGSGRRGPSVRVEHHLFVYDDDSDGDDD